MEHPIPCPPRELEDVMERYGGMVFRLAYSHTRSRPDAEDIYQEVFLRYFRKRPAFESEEHRRAWLLRVTVNRAKSHLTSAWMRNTVPLEDRIPIPEPEESGLDEALRKLPQADRMLLHLSYYEGCTTREIARVTGKTEGAVRTHLTRARKRLAAILKGETP